MEKISWRRFYLANLEDGDKSQSKEDVREMGYTGARELLLAHDLVLWWALVLVVWYRRTLLSQCC
jgi:hypothetical protein